MCRVAPALFSHKPTIFILLSTSWEHYTIPRVLLGPEDRKMNMTLFGCRSTNNSLDHNKRLGTGPTPSWHSLAPPVVGLKIKPLAVTMCQGKREFPEKLLVQKCLADFIFKGRKGWTQLLQWSCDWPNMWNSSSNVVNCTGCNKPPLSNVWHLLEPVRKRVGKKIAQFRFSSQVTPPQVNNQSYLGQ